MNDILMTNIFFTITAVSSIITTIAVIIVTVYVVRFVKKVNEVTQVVKDETVKVVGDVEEVRSVVRQHINVAKNVASATFIKTLVEKGMGLKAIAKALTRSEESTKKRAKLDKLKIKKMR